MALERCDVLVCGGGPAGSSCAWRLLKAGLDVLVLDRAQFPRDKPCAGWITPQVLDDLAIDVNEYRRGRTFQAITGFRIGAIGADRDVAVRYDRAVSFGVRRCEFDHYLLVRSGARVTTAPVTSIRRDGGDIVVNDSIRTPMLVGAGGHFCPAAAWINGPPARRERAPLVLAQEAEFPMSPAGSSAAAAGTPEFYFAEDFGGYGWVCRKEQYLNVGYGHLADGTPLPGAVERFVRWLVSRGRVPAVDRWPWRGHAYLLRNGSARRVSAAGVLLVGDSAGLAYPQSGEGIRPAVESGLLAAQTILEAHGEYSAETLDPYEGRLRRRFANGGLARALTGLVPTTVAETVGRTVVAVPWLVRNLVVDRWFLHAKEPPLAA